MKTLHNPLTLIILAVLSITNIAFSQRATFSRYPSLSPDGSQIAFSYSGDIWTVPSTGGKAYRLTVKPGFERSPKWSPDGGWIAFSADWEGDDDIYVMPSDGGDIRRLTYMDVDDYVSDWTPDSKFIIFTSRRDDHYPDYSIVYKIPVEGGMPIQIMDDFGEDVVIDRTGSKLLYTLNGGQRWRKYYRGSAAAQVWQYNLNSGEHKLLAHSSPFKTVADFRMPSARWPLWGANKKVYMVSDAADSTNNLWVSEEVKGWMPVTDYKVDGIRYPSISFDGNVIAYEHGMDIYVKKGASPAQKVDIVAPIDIADEPQTKQFDSDAVKVGFTPDSKQMFLEVRGEIFASRIVGEEDKAARGRANLISDNSPYRDGEFTVSPTGDSLIFVSDRDGNRNLYLTYSDDPDTKEPARALSLKKERLTDNLADDHDPQWSPDGHQVAFIRGKGDLYIFDLQKKTERLLLSGWSMYTFRWSPDGKWIAYARDDDEYNTDIFIIPVEGGNPVNISRHPDEDNFPVWSADGKKLGFRSRRRENNWDIYFVYLTWADHQKTEADWAEAARAKSSADKKDKDKSNDKEDKKATLVSVQIDTTDIFRRIRTVTNLAGTEGDFTISPDGQIFAFTADHEGENDIYSIKWTGKDIKRLTEGGTAPKWLQFTEDGKKIWNLDKSGRIRTVSTSGKDKEIYDFTAFVEINLLAERQQKFDEIWRTLNDEYYDADFHGQNWQSLKSKYEPMVDASSCEQDFKAIVEMMFGELNSSHMGYWSPKSGKGQSTGRLGIDFDYQATGPGLSVKHILPYGSADREASRIEVGERILKISGTDVNLNVNINQLLNSTVNEQVELIVSDSKGKKSRRVFIRPINKGAEGYLRYHEWVEERSELVDSLSNGKLGYLHIRGMGDESLARFEAQLYSVANGKDGLVIDVRNNGGGWITDYLLAMLQVKRHTVTFPRDGGPGYPQDRLPLYSWTKPIIVLCNEHSFSNAEIFSHAIKTLGRGKVVGIPTPGGVISTGGHDLIDGSGFRVPLRGWYVGDKPERDVTRDLEGNGAVPDVIVPMMPGEIEAGEDRQLIKAVEEMLEG